MQKPFYQDIKLGIIGGGQLGRMLIQSSVDFNIHPYVLDADESSPCRYSAFQFVHGDPTNYEDVIKFGKDLDIITIEIENVNTDALIKLQKMGKEVYPQPEVIKLIQDKRTQKNFYKKHGIPTSEFILTDNKADVEKNIDFLPAVQKLGKAGYDGRGVQKLLSASDLSKAFDAPSLLEKFVDFEKEISVITARNSQGEIAVYPVVELVFHPEYNLVEYLFAPAKISKEIEEKAFAIARKVVEKLEIVGLLAVEMFLTKTGEILVNEVAPRPHNSGHHTIKANYTSQFEQHLRAILGLPLGNTGTLKQAAMVNILGEEGHSGIAIYKGIEEVLKIEGAYPHLYGKKFTKPKRKMGHITIIEDDFEKLIQKVNKVKETIKVVA